MLTLLARISRANLDVFFSWHPTMLSGLLMAYHWAGCATAALTWASWVVSRRHCGLLRQWTAPAAPWANRIVLPHRGPLGLGAGIRGNSLG